MCILILILMKYFEYQGFLFIYTFKIIINYYFSKFKLYLIIIITIKYLGMKYRKNNS